MDYSYKTYIIATVCSILLWQHAMAQTVKIKNYTDMTITGKTFITNNDTINIQNVNVTEKGQLIVFTPKGVNIKYPFSVSTGGEVYIFGRTITHSYTYDKNGNRTSRK